MSSLKVTASQCMDKWKRYIGIGEQPPGSNHNAITKWYGFDGPWCAMTVSKVLYDAGILDEVFGGKIAYTPNIYKRGKKLGQLVNKNGKYQKGDIILYNFGKPDGWEGRPLGIHHVGQCISDLGGGKFANNEGNTDNDCKRRVRSKSNVAAVFRPNFRKPIVVAPPAGAKRRAKVKTTTYVYIDKTLNKKFRILGIPIKAGRGGEVQVEVYSGGKAGIKWGGSLNRRVWVRGNTLGKAYMR